MKITEDTILQLRKVLSDYIAESGESIGKYLFSKEIGKIENRLYSETAYRFFEPDVYYYSSEIFSGEIEGELSTVEDASHIPFLEIV